MGTPLQNDYEAAEQVFEQAKARLKDAEAERDRLKSALDDTNAKFITHDDYNAMTLDAQKAFFTGGGKLL